MVETLSTKYFASESIYDASYHESIKTDYFFPQNYAVKQFPTLMPY